MLVREFRNDEFVDREEEIEFIKKWVENAPKEILWLYGPKSTGKTTLIEYVIENELTNGLKIFDKYWIKYISFRRTMVSSYDSFIDSFFEVDEEDDYSNEINTGFNIGIFKLEAKTYEKIKQKKKNLFYELINSLKKINKTKILVIDEIQVLEDIYSNGEKELLKEFLNFCVSLTKELHLVHVIILSSNTVFIERIYNDAKLKVTSRFKKIDHLDKNTTFEYLEYKGIKDNNEKELIYDYLGGCIPLIQRLFREIEFFRSIKEYLEEQVSLAESEIIDLMIRHIKRKDIFKKIIEEIINKGYYLVDKDENIETLEVIEFLAEREIFFYDPLTRKVNGNNRVYEKAFERILK